MIAITAGEVKDPDVVVQKSSKSYVYSTYQHSISDFKIWIQFGNPWFLFLTAAYIFFKKGSITQETEDDTDDILNKKN
jgi:hypothetical protein